MKVFLYTNFSGLSQSNFPYFIQYQFPILSCLSQLIYSDQIEAVPHGSLCAYVEYFMTTPLKFITEDFPHCLHCHFVAAGKYIKTLVCVYARVESSSPGRQAAVPTPRLLESRLLCRCPRFIIYQCRLCNYLGSLCPEFSHVSSIRFLGHIRTYYVYRWLCLHPFSGRKSICIVSSWTCRLFTDAILLLFSMAACSCSSSQRELPWFYFSPRRGCGKELIDGNDGIK